MAICSLKSDRRASRGEEPDGAGQAGGRGAERSDLARASRPGRQRHGCEAAHVPRIRRRQAGERREDRRRPV